MVIITMEATASQITPITITINSRKGNTLHTLVNLITTITVFRMLDLFLRLRTINQNGTINPRYTLNITINGDHQNKQREDIHRELISIPVHPFQPVINTRSKEVTRTIKHHNPYLINRVPTDRRSHGHTHRTIHLNSPVMDHQVIFVATMHGHHTKDEAAADKGPMGHEALGNKHRISSHNRLVS
jgi:hypothetical protein